VRFIRSPRQLWDTLRAAEARLADLERSIRQMRYADDRVGPLMDKLRVIQGDLHAVRYHAERRGGTTPETEQVEPDGGFIGTLNRLVG